MSGLVLVATWSCWISYKNGYAELLVLHLVPPLNTWLHRYYFGRCSSELAQLVPLPCSRGRSTRYFDRFHDFSVTIPRSCKDVCVNIFFPRTGRLWNSLPIECFPLTYDLNGFKFRISRHLFNYRFFLNRFPVCLNLFVLLFCTSMPCSGCSTLHGVNPNEKKTGI